MPLLETVATMGLMFFIFMIGLELDLQSLGKTGRKAFLIAIAGIVTPLAATTPVANLVRSTVSPGSRLGPLIIFIGTPLSISAFSVLVRIMAELRLVSTEIGKLATPSVAVNDVALWTLLAVGVALAGPKPEPLNPLWVLLCGIAFGIFMFTVVRYVMRFVVDRAVKHGKVSDMYVSFTLLGVLLSGLCTDCIGVHSLLGPFLFGLVIPKDNPFPKLIMEKIEDFISSLMLPLFFASSGLKTNLASLHGVVSIGLLLLFFATAAIGKIVGTFIVARLLGLSSRQALILGFLMNTKGLGVLIVLNIGKDLKALTDEIFAVLVLTCLLTSFLTFPIVSALCNFKGGDGLGKAGKFTDEEEASSKGGSSRDEKAAGGFSNSYKMSRILVCTDNDAQFPALVNIVEAMRGARKGAGGTSSNATLKLYTLRLTHLLFDRRTSLVRYMKLATARPASSKSSTDRSSGPSSSAIQLYFPPSRALSKVKVKPLPPIDSPNLADSLHNDILKVARSKRASLIILPYHQVDSSSSNEDAEFAATYASVVANNSTSVVGILVDSTSLGTASAIHPCFFAYSVLVLFIGGTDDRETLAVASTMADNPSVSVKVIRMVCRKEPPDEENRSNSANQSGEWNHQSELSYAASMDATKEEIADNEAILKIKQKAADCPRLACEDHHYCVGRTDGSSLTEVIQQIATTSIGDVHLYMVGRGISNARATVCLTDKDSTKEERKGNPTATFGLGIVGDTLLKAVRVCSTTGHGAANPCILVVQR
ncbi:hypothetical protein KP509_15G019600 [Ceratopteris richardii]|nr:hypothetical protein KP509_15G019600 [Ceratopteris richardii]